MAALRPGLADRLYGAGRAGLTVEQYKDGVARDLEDLLNARVAMPAHWTDACPLAAGSVLDYGLADFSALSLGSADDRATVCASLRRAIARHEPRLADVMVRLDAHQGAVNRLHFVVSASLLTLDGKAAVHFNVVFQPSSLRYAIGRRHAGTPDARRPPPTAI